MHPDDVEPVVVDVESTGLVERDKITLVGVMSVSGSLFDYSLTVTIYSTKPFDTKPVEETVQSHTDVASADVSLVECPSEKELLDGVRSALETHASQSKNVVAGYNFKSRKGNGFDFNKLADATNRVQLQSGERFEHPVSGHAVVDLYDVLVAYGDTGLTTSESLTVDSLSSRGMLNAGELDKFADAMEERFKSEVTERYDEDVPEEIENGLTVSDWSSGSRKKDTISSLKRVEPVLELPFIQDAITEWLDENGFDTPTESAGSLEEYYELKRVYNSSTYYFDPLESSEDCIDEFESGNVSDVVLHNIQDMLMAYTLFDMLDIPSCDFRVHEI